MSSIKQKLYGKIGITENTLKGNNLFSTNIKSPSGYSDNSKLNNGEKAIKFLSNANPNIKKASIGATAYQNYKIDLLVPNSEPPKPLITLDTAKNKYSKKKNDGNFYLTSPLKNTTANLTDSSRFMVANRNSKLESLSSNLKLTSKEFYSPSKIKLNRQGEMNTCKLLLFIFL